MRFCNPVKPVRKDGKKKPSGKAHIYLGGRKAQISLISWVDYSSLQTSQQSRFTSTFSEDHVVVSSPAGHNYAKKKNVLRPVASF